MKDPEHESIEKNPFFVGWFPRPRVKGFPKKLGRIVRHYNPALCELPDGTLWMVWRAEMQTGLSQLLCGILDPDTPEILEARWLDVGHENPEDPRLIRCGNAVWINYLEAKFTQFGTSVEQVFRRVDPDLQEVVGERIVPPVGKNGKGIEKNWTMFPVPGREEPLLHYSPEQGGVYTLDGEEVAAPLKRPWRHPCGSWSGRSQAYLVDDRYVAIGGGAYYWPGHLKRYFLSAWSFEASKPYGFDEVSRRPLVWASEDDERIPSPRDPKHKPCVVFTGGAQPMEDRTWLVPAGIHDSTLALFRIPFNKFDLVPLQELDTEPRRKTYHEALSQHRAVLRKRQFVPMANPPGNPSAIVYPWKHDAAKWQEIRYSLRSVEAFFEDKECPIYIVGTRAPNFLLQNHPRAKFIPAWSYWEALAKGVQLASRVLWMNDDIFFLRPTGWEDCEGAAYLGEINPYFVDGAPPQTNAWKEGVVNVLQTLRKRGIETFRVYSTHTPYVFHRREAVQVLKEFGVWDKMPFEMAYFHLHGTPRKIGPEKVVGVPFGRARFLNIADHQLTEEVKTELQEMFPDFAPWELKRGFTV